MDHRYHESTAAELQLQHARLKHRAAQLRVKWRAMVPTSARCAATGRQVRMYERLAADYEAILKTVHDAGVSGE